MTKDDPSTPEPEPETGDPFAARKKSRRHTVDRARAVVRR